MTKNKVCDVDGVDMRVVRPLSKPYKNKAIIKHYYFKTVEEGCKKIQRGDINPRALHVNLEDLSSRADDFKKRFFEVNKKTDEKVQFIENYLKSLMEI